MGNVRANFFRANDRDMVEITVVGDKNSYITKVDETHIARFPLEWEAYQSGDGKADYGGTPLTDIEGIDAAFAVSLTLKGIHNVEMLAGLTDAAASSLGNGIVTLRKKAKALLADGGKKPSAPAAPAGDTSGLLLALLNQTLGTSYPDLESAQAAIAASKANDPAPAAPVTPAATTDQPAQPKKRGRPPAAPAPAAPAEGEGSGEPNPAE